jgi:hypothetical protein
MVSMEPSRQCIEFNVGSQRQNPASPESSSKAMFMSIKATALIKA